MAELNIYQKLQKARVEFQGMKINKSGENKFAHYKYFELGDFLPQVNILFDKYGLNSIISFTHELVTMTIYDTDNPRDTIVITSPMEKAELKGCHPIQNLGAVQTYQRRYLYMAALEIVENDALGATTGKAEPEPRYKPSPKPKPTTDATRPETIARIVKGEPNVYPLNAAIQSARIKYLGVTNINDETIPFEKLVSYLAHIAKKYVEQKEKANAKSE